ncbi:uncharacterized protein FOMMEDRAFT_156256 [Fomitiporia mediterranea MF3/22]|uniref:uncharacterized protein n=1 Tax=Fomitiporia mediterranea (strain MF3/22) TaxID=694068 RepID=UPI0004408F2F|nr:uncharacterized protein FOMMEDRAFT_156256 [Fomitiporia mediterranea MF3/22]EJD02893.1 hypothetical protein FOMMEDRAFT_156256 [Fomitiporia mediterranea MF3/22]
MDFFHQFEAPLFQPEADIVPVPPAPRMEPVGLPDDNDQHDWYIWDAPAEEGDALRLFEVQITGNDFVAVPLALESEGNYDIPGRIQVLLESINNVNETLRNLRQAMRNGFGDALDGAVIDVFQEARDMLATKLIDTIGTELVHHGGDATYPIQVVLAILMERFLDGHAEDGDVEILNAIAVNINL